MTEESLEKATAVVLPTHVDEVVLLEDRAQVVRAGRGVLPAGRVKLRVEGVSPVLADKTLGVELGAQARGIRVVQARVHRRHVVRSGPPQDAFAEIENLAREREAALRALAAQDAVARDALESNGSSAKRALEEMAADVSWGRADTEAWARALTGIREREQALRAERRACRARREDLEEALHDLQERLQALATPATDFRATLEAELLVEAEQEVSLRFRYLVPCACWRPHHTAELRQEDAGWTLRFATDGCVWQNTGEDWADARLVFSTQRLSLGAEPPLLTADVLTVRDRADALVVEERDQAVETAGPGFGARRTAPELPGIDDGGASLTFCAAGRSTVPSDGRPHRVAILAFTSTATVELVCFPERAPAAVLRCEGENTSSSPVLAGPVDLVAASGHQGRTTILYVAPQGRLELGFGPDASVRVHRRLDEVEHERSMISKWVRTDVTTTLFFSNIGAEEKTFSVTERIPVSEVEQVRVRLDEAASSPGTQADRDGFVRWTVTLPAGGTAERKLRYTLERHKDVRGL